MSIKEDENNDIKKEEPEENVTIKRNIEETEEYDRSIKVIILGDTNVGKTSIINRLKMKKSGSPSYIRCRTSYISFINKFI